MMDILIIILHVKCEMISDLEVLPYTKKGIFPPNWS